MSREECCLVLGVAPYAAPEVVRQTYKDLVRVWHPDRFQYDPELRHRAELQLQKINEAYLALKDGCGFSAPSPEPPPPAAPQPQPQVVRPERLAWRLGFRWPLKVAWLTGVSLTVLVISGVVLSRIRVPRMDALVIPGGQSATATDSGQSLLEALSQQARNQVAELWNPIGGSGGDTPLRTAAGDRAKLQNEPNPATPGAPANGTELLRARAPGGSQIWVSNQSGQDVVATLRDSGTALPVRAIYVQARSKASIRNIGAGVYSLTAETGEGWDTHHGGFETQRRVCARTGPFQCMDLTSGRTVSGRCFDLNAADGTATPRTTIAIGAR